MKNDFLKENQRKTKLFDMWIDFLTKYHSSVGDIEYEEIFEGIAQFSKQTRRNVDLRLGDGRTVKDLEINAEISRFICLSDQLYVVIGKKRRKWYFLDIISIGSVVSEDAGGIHITFNPIYMRDGLNESRFH